MSRLDRLVVILETGSTQFIRNTAADQLADLARGHPEETINLLGRVYPFLKSNKWETRIAAARAFGGIVNHSDIWDPNSEDAIKKEELKESIVVKKEEDENIIKLEQDEELRKIDVTLSNLTSFDSFSLHEILKTRKKLLASNIEEADVSEALAVTGQPKKQRSVKEEDDTNGALKEEEKSSNASTNARLKAMQRRRAKVNAKSSATKVKPIDLSQSSISRKLVEDKEDQEVKSEAQQYDVTSQQGGEKLVIETKAPELSPLLSQHSKVAGLVWPFQGVYELLISDLFDEKWEIRHGSALGLRELVKKHGTGAGRVMNRDRLDNDRNNMATLEDLAVRLCTLFALDRFGDYVSDTVVAPVRESGAQTLAALLIHLDDTTVIKTFRCLYELVLQRNELVKIWETKHGGMLGVRYFVSIRTDILEKQPDILDSVVELVLHGLKESDDDVQAVAALTLAPIASQFVETKQELIPRLLSVIWDCLTNLRDDLSASIGSVMDLLAKLCKHKEVIEIMQNDAISQNETSFETLVPKLFPFLRHSITNVRKSVLRTILDFVSINDTKKWITSKTLRLIFQNLLVEQNQDVLDLTFQVYRSLMDEIESNPDIGSVGDLFVMHYQPLLTLIMTPIGIARHNYQMNTNLIMRPSGHSYGPIEDEKRRTKRQSPTESSIPHTDLKVNIDAPIFKGDVTLVGYDIFIKTRCAAVTAYGYTLSCITDETFLMSLLENLSRNLSSPHSTPRLFSAMIVQEYANALNAKSIELPPKLKELFVEPIFNVLETPDSLTYFRELVPILKSLRTACLQLFDVFITQAKVSPSKMTQIPVVVQGEAEAGPGAFGIDTSEKIVNELYPKLMKNLSASARVTSHQALEDAKHRIQVAMDEAKASLSNRLSSILSTYSATLVALSGVPKKLNPIIRSLMDNLKQEECVDLQRRSAMAIAQLIQKLNELGKRGAADKMIKNLCAFLCVDTSEVPEFHHNAQFKDKILSLRKEEAKTDPTDIALHEKAVHEAKIKRNGGIMALDGLLNIYKENLFDKLPKLKDTMIEPLKSLDFDDESDEAKGQSIIDALGVLRALLPRMHPSLHSHITDHLEFFLLGFNSPLSIFRYSTAKCFATISVIVPSKAFTFLVKHILPSLGNSGSVRERQGAIECIYHLSNTMGPDILPYIVFLIVPVLGRMSDADPDVRILATTTFASIIKLVPLEAGIPDPNDMPQELLEGRDREREFIQQMMDPTKIKSFDLPVSIKATLRKYQQEGVNWLAFLNKYHLHGILCDDMGLGKTLQTLCIVASDHHMRSEKFKESGEKEFRKLPSIIICPPSLTGHWEQEVNQYAPFLKVLVYAGGPSVRASLRSKISSCDVLVTSYDVCRNDNDHISACDFNYCVLDEGHIIKNPSSKLTIAVKKLRAEHRLILSGTPIQNNVLELWSLFDFLMPGFLGTEKVFHEKFAKPIVASRNSKTSSKEQEAGALALESLHKQVLPFMLRRLKEDVLSDLPPKIIQDYFCELSDLQKRLYKDFIKKQKTNVQEEVSNDEGKTHIFQALQYMRKLCNHPALVVSPSHPQFGEVQQFLEAKDTNIKSMEHSPKLMSLKTLLLECGIGIIDSDYYSKKKQVITSEGVISEHRALIFCQLKDMLDIVEKELLKKHLPSVTYMRLDGSTDPRDRQSIVRKFNEDPSIDVLLLTTKVGGLGLNLTGADTVIFVEHDWNPMNDLQAMDRAHRLGQKKVVNVYRLITKNTLEEKIMGLQKFKMNIASTIVNQQNSGLASMDTNQLLDLFDVDESATKLVENGDEKENVPDDVAGGLQGKAAGMVGELGELWDESQYEDEYNLDAFIKTLK